MPPFFQRFSFFVFVLFFAGSVVLIAAHDLRSRKFMGREGDEAQAQRLIKTLTGNPLSKVGQEQMMEVETMPQRQNGQYLSDNDKSTLKHALRSILPSNEEK